MKRRDFLLGAGALALSPYFLRHAWAANGGASQYLMPSESAPHQATWMAYGATAGAWGDTGVQGWRKDPAKREHGIVDQPIGKDQKIATFVAKYTHSPLVKTWLVMEGGGIEVDGKGNAICTESCILNDNRNPNRSKAEVEQELHRVLGVNNITWLRGLKARDVTDAHIDFYARFTDDDSVLCAIDDEPESPDYAVTRDNLRVLKQHHRKVIELHAPNYETVQAAVEARQYKGFRFNEDGFAAGYIGFYVANGCIILPQFGDPDADREAFDIVSQSHPDRTVLQIATDGIANGGGSIHCATQQEIA